MPTPRRNRPAPLRNYLFGCTYYPEHWSEADRANDAAWMAEAGINVVRMAEFAWDVMEPQRDDFHFELFQKTIAEMGKYGIETILCTPTATPPRWLTRDHDKWMRVDNEGRPMQHGSRQHVCTNRRGFREESRRITGAMAEAFKDDPLVIGWQTDNEFFCHFSECHCGACQRRFRRWLRHRYEDDLEKLNEAWGTRFWSQTYSSWSEIDTPRKQAPTYENPTQQLDYHRFLSESLLDFQREQIDILRAANPTWWVTHNGTFEHIDHWGMGTDLDFYSVDIYPGFLPPQTGAYSGSSFMLSGTAAATGTFVVMEQQSGPGGQANFLMPNPEPGQMRLWAWRSVGHGADGILHFRWRTCRFGAEMHWHGVLDHDNIRRRRFHELVQEGQELKKLMPAIKGSAPRVDIGILTDLDQNHLWSTMSHELPGPYPQQKALFEAFARRHYAVGMVDANDELAGYQMLILPSFAKVDAVLIARLTTFVENGGTVLATAQLGTRDAMNHKIPTTPPGGGLDKLFGLRIEEWGTTSGKPISINYDGRPGTYADIYEIADLRGAESIASWVVDREGGAIHQAAGHAALTRNKAGQGEAWYFASLADGEAANDLVSFLAGHLPVEPLASADSFVEIVVRQSDDRTHWFVLNHYPETRMVAGLPSGLDLLTDNEVPGKLELEAYGVAVIEEK
ncbi:MAG: hypothetical protein DRP71_15860 [Verrucomicrobia bacterium]|nr:MAG: hypothetical protein DRP71_15860 [Verrucomicrobiota bacterium]